MEKYTYSKDIENLMDEWNEGKLVSLIADFSRICSCYEGVNDMHADLLDYSEFEGSLSNILVHLRTLYLLCIFAEKYSGKLRMIKMAYPCALKDLEDVLMAECSPYYKLVMQMK